MDQKLLTREFLYLIHQTTCLIDKAIDAALLRDHGVSFSQFLILMTVGHHPGVSQQDIATALDITPAAISRQIRTLTEQEYLQLNIHPTDRRAQVLRLTTKGRKAFERGIAVIDKEMQDLGKGLPDQSLAALTSSLSHIHSQLRNTYCDTGICSTPATAPPHKNTLKHHSSP